MDGTPVQIVSLSSVMFVAGLCFAVTGFGSGIILNIGYWSLVSLGLIPNSGLSTVLVYLTVSSIFVSMCQAIHYRKYIKFQPKFAIIYVVFTFIATMIGIEILTRNDNPILTRILGGVLFITFMINFSKDYIYPYFQRRKRTEKQKAKNAKNEKTEKKNKEKKKNEKQQMKIKRKRTSSDHDLSETDKDDSETDIEIEFDMDTDIDTNLPLNDTTNLHANDTSDNETDHEGTTPRRRKNDFVLVQSHSDCKKLAENELENGELDDNDDEDENGIPSDIVKYELDRWYKYLSLIIAVLSSGFLRGLFGAGGPPMILYFLITNIDKRIVRSLAPVAIGFGSGIPFIVYLLIIKGEFEPSQWITYLSTFIGFLSGLLVGNAIHKYVDQNTFRAVLLFILFCGSINLMLTDLGKISVYSSSILMGIFMILLIFIAVRVVQNKLAHGKDKKGAQPLPQKDDD